MLRPVLLTAGATRNRVDAIRYLSANAGGSTVLQLIGHLELERGVHLMGSEEAVLRAQLWVAERRLAGLPFPMLTVEVYEGTRDLMERMERWILANPDSTIIHSAAVGDYEVEAHDSKIPSGQEEVILKLHPGPKIVDFIRSWAPECRLVSFKAGRPGLTPEQLREIAQAQLARTRSDRVFANVIGSLDHTAMLVGGGVRPFFNRTEAIAALAADIRSWDQG